MGNIMQLHSTTPEQFKESIIKDLDKRFDELKKHFQPKEPDEYLTAKELERELKISNVTRWEWGKKGVLKPRKIGNRTYYLRSEVRELLLNSNK